MVQKSKAVLSKAFINTIFNKNKLGRWGAAGICFRLSTHSILKIPACNLENQSALD